MEIGVNTFGEIIPESVSGKASHAHQRIQELLEEVKLAEEVGLDVFSFGEIHRPEFVVSSPEIIIAAAAAITKRIRFSSAVTILSTLDPVRVFEQFATADLISGGRVELIVGRGAFNESYPLFGYDLTDSEELFTEKLDLLMRINAQEKVSWEGKHRPAVQHLGVYPRPYQESLPIWQAVSRTPASAERSGKLNLPMAMSMMAGAISDFVPLVNVYRAAAKDADHDISQLKLTVFSQLYVADDAERAREEYYPSYESIHNRLSKERGFPATSREKFENSLPDGPLVIGDVQQAIDKIMYMYELFQNTRYIAHIDGNFIPHKNRLRAIELLGTHVAPVIRKETSGALIVP